MVETAASYWEPIVRIYGSSLKRGLVMLTLRFDGNSLGFWGERIARLEGDFSRFELALTEQVGGAEVQLVLICEENNAEHIYNELAGEVERTGQATMERIDAVELLYFHGPHFQDRFGIAEAALGCLQKNKIQVLAVGCTGTSIYLVTRENMGHKAAEALAEIFVVP